MSRPAGSECFPDAGGCEVVFGSFFEAWAREVRWGVDGELDPFFASRFAFDDLAIQLLTSSD
jgi:hypothetical protein